MVVWTIVFVVFGSPIAFLVMLGLALLFQRGDETI